MTAGPAEFDHHIADEIALARALAALTAAVRLHVAESSGAADLEAIKRDLAGFPELEEED